MYSFNIFGCKSYELLNDLIFNQIIETNRHESPRKISVHNSDEKIIDGIYSDIDHTQELNFHLNNIDKVMISSEIIDKTSFDYLKEPKILQININNVNNVNYGIRSKIGSPPQLFSLIIDIKSPNSWIQSINCKNCNIENNKFNKEQSKSYKSFELKKQLNYTHNGISGILSEDKIGLSELEQIPQTFINVEEQWRIGNMYFDGILSLSFPGTYFIKLKEKGIIPEAKLCLFLADINKNSFVLVGGISSTYVKDPSQILWTTINTISNNNEEVKDPSLPNWNFGLKKFSVNDKQYDEINNVKAIIDSMSYGIKIPKNHFFTFKEDFFPKNAECQFRTDNYIHCGCNNESVKEFPTLSFEIETDKKIILKPNDYIEITTSTSDYSKSCRILISLNYNDDVWSLGTIILNVNYLILDYENLKVGFYRLNGENFPEGGNNVILITIIIVSACAVLFSLVYILYKKFVSAFGGRNDRNNNQRNNSRNNQDYAPVNE